MADVESAGSYQPQSYPSIQSVAIPERIQHWRKDLLKDLTLLPRIKGQRPGRIVVYGDHAVPVLTGSRNEDVVIASGEFGPKHGRIVVLSHHRYLAQFCIHTDQEELSILHENINHWVTNGEFANKEQIAYLKGKQDLSDLPEETKILIWASTTQVASEQLEQDILEFLMNGGALVYGICPHKWKKRNKKETMEDIPLGGILSKIGIGFCSNRVSYGIPQGFEINIKLPETQQALAHAQFLINKCCTETNKELLHQHALKFVHYFKDAPAGLIETLKDKLYMLFAKCHEIVTEEVPSEEKKLIDPKSIASLAISSVLSELELGYNKIPGMEYFPGDVSTDSELLTCAHVTIKSQGHEAHPTGLWVPAGQKCEVRVISQQCSDDELEGNGDTSGEESEDLEDDDEDLDDWYIRIGSHSDTLYHKEVLKRWPNLIIRVPLATQQQIFTPYGGLLYLVSPRTMSQISIQISGVVEAPYFDLRDPVTVEHWENARKASGPWADICGQWFRITVLSSSIRDLDNPTQVMKVWDDIILQNHELRGTRPTRREWLVADAQPVVGKMHSGYPIVANMKVAEPDGALSYERLTTLGFWGIFHELGHNMQRNMWTFEGTREVTCNIFALYAAERTAKQSVWIHEWLKRHIVKMKEYLEDGAEFSEWQAQNGVALGFYAQLAHHFSWQSYKRVFWRYEAIPLKRRPATTQARIDEWILRFSDAVGYNLVPLAEFWGIPVTDPTQQKLKPLKPFLPDDDMTQLCEKRVKTLLKKYPRLTRVVDKEKLKLDRHWCPVV